MLLTPITEYSASELCCAVARPDVSERVMSRIATNERTSRQSRPSLRACRPRLYHICGARTLAGAAFLTQAPMSPRGLVRRCRDDGASELRPRAAGPPRPACARMRARSRACGPRAGAVQPSARPPVMPLYDILIMAKAAATRPAVSEVLRRAATQVMDAGGVVTDVKSYGTRDLAYEIRKAGESHVKVCVVRRSVSGWKGGAAASRRPANEAPARAAPRVGADAAHPLPAQGQYVQLSAMTGPAVLKDITHSLRTDERVIRWLLVKKQALPRLPKLKELRRIESELCVPGGRAKDRSSSFSWLAAGGWRLLAPRATRAPAVRRSFPALAVSEVWRLPASFASLTPSARAGPPKRRRLPRHETTSPKSSSFP